MHKSVIIGLLASSLVMLVLVPFLNQQQQNSFLNTAMAQGYDDNYYGDSSNSSYSQYPTTENKYECRTGPFKGFFVSSVEFCEHVKFDDTKRDSNRTGTQGPPGPTRVTGATGATGPQEIQGPICPNGTQGQPGPAGPSFEDLPKYTVAANNQTTNLI